MTEAQPATVEINDAVFCTHLKEVVRVTPHCVDIDGLTTSHRLNSAQTVATTEGRRTILSTGSIPLLDRLSVALTPFLWSLVRPC